MNTTDTNHTNHGRTLQRAGLLLLAYAIVQATLLTFVAVRLGHAVYAEGLFATAVVLGIAGIVVTLVGSALRP